MSTAASYVLHSASQAEYEASRLDMLNSAFREFFQGRLSLAPIEESDLRSILDIGCGSGAWAITTANCCPKADVVAVDVNPIPLQRVLPLNCQFLQLDISTQLPFQREAFDVIHARLVLLHLPNVETVLKRVADILKPGGIIILEDPDDEGIDENNVMQGLAGKSPLVSEFFKIMRQRGGNPCIGRDHARMLTALGCFSEVHTRKLNLPLTRTEDSSIDPSVLKFMKAWKESYKIITASIPTLHKNLSGELITQFLSDLDNPTVDMISTFYFTWARKAPTGGPPSNHT